MKLYINQVVYINTQQKIMKIFHKMIKHKFIYKKPKECIY